MPNTKQNWNTLDEKAKAQALKNISAFFLDERGEEIGVIAAESLLDFFIEQVGPDIYNKAIDDAKIAFRKQLEGMDFEIDLLKRQN